MLSMGLHFMILYVPFFSKLFAITALTWTEWQGVLWISAPIILIDEVLKALSRNWVHSHPHGVTGSSATVAVAAKAKESSEEAPHTPGRRRSSPRKMKRA